MKINRIGADVAPGSSSGIVDVARKVWTLIDARYRWLLLLLLVLTSISATLEVLSIAAVLPLFQIMLDPTWIRKLAPVREIVGDHLPSQYLLLACVVIVILFATKIGVSLFAGWLRLNLNSKIYQQLSTRLLGTYMSYPLSFHLRHGSAELLRNMTSYAGQVGQYGFLGLTDLIGDSLFCAGIFLALVVVEPIASTLALVSFAIVGAIYLAVGKPYFHRWAERYKQSSAATYQSALDALVGIKTLKAFRCEPFFEQRYGRQVADFTDIQRNNAFAGLIPRQLLEFMVVAALVIPIGWLAINGRDPASLLPVLAVFGAAAYRIMPSIVRIVTAIQGFRFSRVALDVVYGDFVRPKEMRLGPSLASRVSIQGGDIRLKAVKFQYDGVDELALDDITLEIKQGEVVAFVGTSGAGKTTLADVILGLHAPKSGTLAVGDIVYANMNDVPDGVFAYVPQDPFLFDETIRRNVALGVHDGEIDEVRLADVIESAALTPFIEQLPRGLNTVIGERGVRLSGGQRQRIGIARALYVDPDALVLDEATSAVDLTTEAEITEAVHRLRGRKTLIIIAHRLSTVRECDRIFYLEKGRIVACGRFDELVHRSAGFQAMVRQMGYAVDTTRAVS